MNETISIDREGWEVRSCDIPVLTETITCSPMDLGNCEDLADGLATILRYQSQGIDSFISYPDYRKRRLLEGERDGKSSKP